MGEPGTELVFARTPKGGDDLGTVLIRRKTAATVYATVSDIVPAGARPSVASVHRSAAPGLAAYALACELADGAREIVLVNYTGGEVSLDGWTTDARVAFARVAGGAIDAFVMAGGRTLRGPEGSVAVDAPTLLVYRAVAPGLGQLANQGGAAAHVRVAGLAAYDRVAAVEAAGRRGDGAKIARGGVETDLAAYGVVELTRGRQPTVAEHEELVRAGKVRAALEAEARARRELEDAKREQYAAARRAPLPAGTYSLVQAEALVDQGGGKVTISDKKAATYGTCFLNWDNRGQWIEYDVDVARDGYYKVLLRYCREGGPVERGLKIDGEFPHAATRAMRMDGTGGWSNGADNWKYYTVEWPLVGGPFLVHLTQGRHRLRLEGLGGDGLNLDYIVFAAQDMVVTREAVEK